MFDLTVQAIQTSLDGLAARQRIIAQNRANSETTSDELLQDLVNLKR